MRIQINKLLLAGIMSFGIFTTALSEAQVVRNPVEYNLQAGVGLKGYDPVSYFPEGGALPTLGLSVFKLDYMGVTYFFISEAHAKLFAENPNKYEPTYGGYCAYAMAFGSKVDIKPMVYTIHGDRLHFFVSTRAKDNFDVDVVGFENNADVFWKKISGEDARK